MLCARERAVRSALFICFAITPVITPEITP